MLTSISSLSGSSIVFSSALILALEASVLLLFQLLHRNRTDRWRPILCTLALIVFCIGFSLHPAMLAPELIPLFLGTVLLSAVSLTVANILAYPPVITNTLRQLLPIRHHSMIRLLTVHASPSFPLIRLGSAHDGGYVVPKTLLDNVSVLYSGGVGDNWEFETDLHNRTGADVHMFDHTISAPQGLPSGIRWRPQALGTAGLLPLLNIGDQTPTSSLWCKLDIEGDEWVVLNGTDADTLRQLSVLVVEFHDLSDADPSSIDLKTAVLQKLDGVFRIMHAHGNNCIERFIAGTAVPDVLELTYVRRDLLPPDITKNSSPLPGMHDTPNAYQFRDYSLNFEPFVWKDDRKSGT